MFALSNPDPEIHPDVAAKYAAVVATGRSDFPQPDQQCAGVPRGVPRCAGRRGAPDHREDDGGRGRGDLLRRQRRPRGRPGSCPSPLDLRVGEAVATAVAVAAEAQHFEG